MRFHQKPKAKSQQPTTLLGWLVAAVGTAVYLLTLEPTVSFWDCGEFIATSHKLQVGHPPGAPLYSLLAHCMMLLAGGNVTRLAWWSNSLSALAGGLTAMFLFWTLVRLLTLANSQQPTANSQWPIIFSALIGTACYLFCDTAWFSATESEVYSLSMLFSSMILWASIRWIQEDDTRWFLLMVMLLGLSLGVHILSLLTIPVIIVAQLTLKKPKANLQNSKFKIQNSNSDLQNSKFKIHNSHLLLALLLFLSGASTYLIIPIRAKADTPINMGSPSNWVDFKAYLTREQYEHAPLLYGRCFNSPIVGYENGKAVYAKEMDMFFPRMWKQHPNAELYYTDWCGHHGKMVNVDGREYYKPSFGDNLIIFGAYQLGYMYMRYLMWNFSGRYNDRQGYGNLQKGQFITGIPPIDRLYVGTGRNLPDAMPRAGHNRYFLLPLLLAFVGIFFHAKNHKASFWPVLTLFLMSSLALSVYLNHPMYEPRERDYAYILSFYTFAIWIGFGTFRITNSQRPKANGQKTIAKAILLSAVPLLMAFQNWNDHDRSGRYIARESAANLLDSCEKNALLFTLGDNDTFPLWYLQQVEGYRTDVHIINYSLLGSESYTRSTKQQLHRQGSDLLPEEGWQRMGPYQRMTTILKNNDASANRRPVYFSHYAFNDRRINFDGRMQLCGMAYRLSENISTDSVDTDRAYQLFTNTLQWHPLDGVYIDETSHRFLIQYWHDALLTATNLANKGQKAMAHNILDSTCHAIDPALLLDPVLFFDIAQAYALCGDSNNYSLYIGMAHQNLQQQLAYYNSMSPKMQSLIPYTLKPLLQLDQQLHSTTLPLQ